MTSRVASNLSACAGMKNCFFHENDSSAPRLSARIRSWTSVHWTNGLLSGSDAVRSRFPLTKVRISIKDEV